MQIIRKLLFVGNDRVELYRISSVNGKLCTRGVSRKIGGEEPRRVCHVAELCDVLERSVVSKIVLAVIVVILNYFFSKLVVFRKKNKQ